VTFDKGQIQKLASYGGVAGGGVDFLKSEAAARKVADKLWRTLQKEYDASLKKEKVRVARSKQYPGTWTVRYRCIPLGSQVSGAKELNARRRSIITEAVKASYSSSDLVDSWG